MDYETHIAPASPIPWLHISEPTGFIGELHLNLLKLSNFTFQLKIVPGSRIQAWGKLLMTLTAGRNKPQFVRWFPTNKIPPKWQLQLESQKLFLWLPGHGVSILAEGTLPILHTGHSLQAAPWSGPCSVQIFGEYVFLNQNHLKYQ